jgi:group I intron endonuclease
MKSNEVYKITNKLTNKVYIGITNQGSGARYRHHWYESRIGEPSPIHRSMAKYGEENFTLEIIDFADTYDELKEKEKYWIKWYNSTDRSIGYNLTEGGDGTFGRMHSEETKEKIRQKALGRKASEDTKKKMSESRKGKCSDKQKEHLSKLQEQCKTKVYQYSKTGEFIAEYDSIIEACKANGLSRNTIRIQLKNPPRNPNDHRIKFLWKTVKTERY